MSGDTFLVDGIAFWRNKDWQRDVRQRNRDRGRRHVFGEEHVQAFTDFGMDY